VDLAALLDEKSRRWQSLLEESLLLLLVCVGIVLKSHVSERVAQTI
jgi:hypothetical protein